MSSYHLTDQAVRLLAKSWWVVTALLLLVGSAVQFELVTEDDLGPLVTSNELAAAPGELAAIPGELDGYPSVDYAGTRFAVLDARAIPVNQTGRPIMIVDLGIENRSDLPARIPKAMIQLVRPDGRTFPLDRFEYTDYTNRLSIPAGSVQQALLVFKLTPGQTGPVSGYDLTIGESGRWPARIGLDGTSPDVEFPIDLVGADGATTQEPAHYQGIRVELLSSVTDIEHGVYRAPIGRYLAVMTVRVVGDTRGVDRSLWAISDGTSETRALRADVLTVSPDQTEATVELVFSYPTDTPQLELLVGRTDRREPVAVFDVASFK